MDPSGIDSFENQWRKALKDASEAPPPSVWEGIEARLEGDNDKGLLLPLWWRSPKIWYAAASIAALLLVGAGIWYSGLNAVDNKAGTKVAVNKSFKSEEEKSNNASKANQPNSQIEEKSVAKSDNPGIQSKSIAEDEDGSAGSSVISGNTDLAVSQTRNSKNSKANTYAAARQEIDKPSISGQDLPVEKENQEVGVTTQSPGSIAFSKEVNIPAFDKDTDSQQSISAELLSSLPYNELDIHMQKRYVFFRPEIRSEEPAKLSAHKEYWAGIGLMPASFNPDVKVKEAPLGFTSQTVANKKSVSGSSEAGVSYALQTQGGMQLSKHWSVELGVSYLKGNSDYQGGGYLLSANNSSSGNVLENALAGIAPPTSSLSADKNYNFANSGSIYVDVSKKSSNNYQYLQLPVQAGFTINPEKKLSYSVLGGMMANFFLSNDLEAASGEIIKTTASDEIYRSMNWAATTGLRFNYRLTSKWRASLTGSYQKAVTSGFKSNQSVDVHPYLYGVAWGVRYSF